jgi:hypothetical protein
MQTRRQKVRHSPQISLNLLGEFMVSSFVRRRSILRQAKFPQDYIGPRYDPAQKAAARYLAGASRDRTQLASDFEALLAGSARSQWFKNRQKLCAQALGCILELETALKLDDLDVSIGCNPDHRVDIGGVSVTVMPDLLLRGACRNGEFVGALKFRYGKTTPISKEWAAYSATTLHQFVETLAGGADLVDRRHCKIIDVFAGRVYEAPACYKERRKDIEAACWHIKEIWSRVRIKD